MCVRKLFRILGVKLLVKKTHVEKIGPQISLNKLRFSRGKSHYYMINNIHNWNCGSSCTNVSVSEGSHGGLVDNLAVNYI